ncbi:MAG: hypothetical protein KGJ43_08790, partial [Acidobacteriota bacterium]|nr:hypothetical protein [Acidobacteriota bacterium]
GPRRTVTITGQVARPAAPVPLRLVEAAATQAALQMVPAGGGELSGEWGAPAGAGADPWAARRSGRTRPRRSAGEWLGAKPDRIASWAVALGFLLVLAGILSAH